MCYKFDRQLLSLIGSDLDKFCPGHCQSKIKAACQICNTCSRPGPLNVVAMARVRVLISFYLTPESDKVEGQPIHKEKFNVPIEREGHKAL